MKPNIIGALENIKEASKASNDASYIVNDVGSKIDVELKPLTNLLKQRIDSSKENFENSDKQLKEYFEIIQSNLTDTFSSISSLNGAVRIIANWLVIFQFVFLTNFFSGMWGCNKYWKKVLSKMWRCWLR